MTAVINSPSSSNSNEDPLKLELVSKVDVAEVITTAALLSREDGIITTSDDKNLRIWLKRENGQYWPSVCQLLPACCPCLNFNYETQRLFVGLENGVISEYTVADDYNKIVHHRDYFSHSGGITSVLFSLSCEWLVSIGKDKSFVWQCSETGRRLGSYSVNEWCASLAFDAPAKYAFVGDYAGNISVLRLKDNACELISRLSAHAGCVKTLAWDAERQLLFSGSTDQLIIVWDIGSKKGSAYELLGHKSKVASLAFASGNKKLFSIDDDGCLVCWDTLVTRIETPEWLLSNVCQRCETPFFWNIKDMWHKKVVGLRQHHCRMCGKAVCDKCSTHSVKYPPMGYELEVRICDGCYRDVENKIFQPWAVSVQTKHAVIGMQLDEMRGRLLTVGSDKVIKIWNVKQLFHS